MAFTSTEPAHIVASSRSGDTILYDLEAGSALLTLESQGSSGKGALGRGSAFLQVLLWLWWLEAQSATEGWFLTSSEALSGKEIGSRLLPLGTTRSPQG